MDPTGTVNAACSTEAPASSLGHIPQQPRWTFDATVAACFDDMLARSIPQYEVMRQATHELGRGFVQPGTDIVDLGCSRGSALAPFVDEYRASNRLVGVEISTPMREASIARFAPDIERGSVRILDTDLRYDYPAVTASLTLAILTLQFVPLEYRHKLVKRAFEHTVPGGCLVMVEKILGDVPENNELWVNRYYAFKRDRGYSQDEIDRKKYSLEGILVPLTARWNEEMLRAAGFSRVECFWRWMNFAGWLAVK